jgi:hypothetical protein
MYLTPEIESAKEAVFGQLLFGSSLGLRRDREGCLARHAAKWFFTASSAYENAR